MRICLGLSDRPRVVAEWTHDDPEDIETKHLKDPFQLGICSEVVQLTYSLGGDIEAFLYEPEQADGHKHVNSSEIRKKIVTLTIFLAPA